MRDSAVPGQGQDGQTLQQLMLEQTPEVVLFPSGQASVAQALGSVIIIIAIIINNRRIIESFRLEEALKIIKSNC